MDEPDAGNLDECVAQLPVGASLSVRTEVGVLMASETDVGEDLITDLRHRLLLEQRPIFFSALRSCVLRALDRVDEVGQPVAPMVHRIELRVCGGVVRLVDVVQVVFQRSQGGGFGRVERAVSAGRRGHWFLTPLPGSSTSLHLWFYGLYPMTSTGCGVSAKQLERAWRHL